jgi:hypothetical protein
MKARQLFFAIMLAASVPALGQADTADSDPGYQDQEKVQPILTRPASLLVEFSDSDRRAIKEYHWDQRPLGPCTVPPAKKSNGCLAAGLAKTWAKGSALPDDVEGRDLPSDLLARLNVPVGHRYFQIASDIVLLSTRGRVVIDAVDASAGFAPLIEVTLAGPSANDHSHPSILPVRFNLD